MKNCENVLTDIAMFHVWPAVYCNSNSEKNLEKLWKRFY